MKNLTERQCIEAITRFINECDSDELARLTGELFGGECYAYLSDEDYNFTYEFEPNKFYSGEFDNIKDEPLEE